MSRKTNFTRRDFLKATMLGLGAAFLAACKRALRATDTPTATLLTPTSANTPEPTATNAPDATQIPTETLTPTEIPCFKLLTPENGAEFPPIGKATFSWEPMPGAEKYELQITLPTNQVVPFDVDTTTYARYLESFPMGGTFTWQVVALDENSATICITEFFTFNKAEKQRPNNDSGDGGSVVGGPVIGTTVGP